MAPTCSLISRDLYVSPPISDVRSVSQYFEANAPIWDIKKAAQNFCATNVKRAENMTELASSLHNILEDARSVDGMVSPAQKRARLSLSSMVMATSGLLSAGKLPNKRFSVDEKILNAIDAAVSKDNVSIEYGVYNEPWTSLSLCGNKSTEGHDEHVYDLVPNDESGALEGRLMSRIFKPFQGIATVPTTSQAALYEDDYKDSYWFFTPPKKMSDMETTDKGVPLTKRIGTGFMRAASFLNPLKRLKKSESSEKVIPESPHLSTLPKSRPVLPALLQSPDRDTLLSSLGCAPDREETAPPTPTRLAMHPSNLNRADLIGSGEKPVLRKNGHDSLARRNALMVSGRALLADLLNRIPDSDESSPMKKAIRDHEDWDALLNRDNGQIRPYARPAIATNLLKRVQKAADDKSTASQDSFVGVSAKSPTKSLLEAIPEQVEQKDTSTLTCEESKILVDEKPAVAPLVESEAALIVADDLTQEFVSPDQQSIEILESKKEEASEICDQSMDESKDETFTEHSFIGRDLLEDEKRMQEMRARRRKGRFAKKVSSVSNVVSNESTGSSQSINLTVLSQLSTTDQVTPDRKGIEQKDIVATPEKQQDTLSDVVDTRPLNEHVKSKLVDVVDSGVYQTFTVGLKQCTTFCANKVAADDLVPIAETGSTSSMVIQGIEGDKPSDPAGPDNAPVEPDNRFSLVCPLTPSTPNSLSMNTIMAAKNQFNENKDKISGGSLRKRILQKKRPLTPKWTEDSAAGKFSFPLAPLTNEMSSDDVE